MNGHRDILIGEPRPGEDVPVLDLTGPPPVLDPAAFHYAQGLVEYVRYVGIISHPDHADTMWQRVRTNYEQTKAQAFPDWPGQHELIEEIEPLGRYRSVGWRADVPDEYVRLHPDRYGPEKAPPEPAPHCRECGAPIDDDGDWIGDGY